VRADGELSFDRLHAIVSSRRYVGLIERLTSMFFRSGDFVRPQLPMDYGVALRRSAEQSFTWTFEQIDRDLRRSCFQYVNVDRSSTGGNASVQLDCDLSSPSNRTIRGISPSRNFNTLLTVALKERRLSGHHVRFIDYADCKWNALHRHTDTQPLLSLSSHRLAGSRCTFQGISHPRMSQCICAPGFYGDQCQFCTFVSSDDSDVCALFRVLFSVSHGLLRTTVRLSLCPGVGQRRRRLLPCSSHLPA
jgi:hypothetical protein